jgi:CBS domain-containing membrane protein
MLDTPILQLIDRDPISLETDRKVSEALRILMSGRIHHLPIVSDRVLVGLLSTVDLLEIKASMSASDDRSSLELIDECYRLENVMKKDIITVSHRATIEDAARQLSAGGFHSLPVVDQSYRLVGMVTTTDLIGHMLEALPVSAPSAGGSRIPALERVYEAAQAFLHSGMAAQEHQKLERALEAVRQGQADISL